jgi:hypothetical protein
VTIKVDRILAERDVGAWHLVLAEQYGGTVVIMQGPRRTTTANFIKKPFEGCEVFDEMTEAELLRLEAGDWIWGGGEDTDPQRS